MHLQRIARPPAARRSALWIPAAGFAVTSVSSRFDSRCRPIDQSLVDGPFQPKTSLAAGTCTPGISAKNYFPLPDKSVLGESSDKVQVVSKPMPRGARGFRAKGGMNFQPTCKMSERGLNRGSHASRHNGFCWPSTRPSGATCFGSSRSFSSAPPQSDSRLLAFSDPGSYLGGSGAPCFVYCSNSLSKYALYAAATSGDLITNRFSSFDSAFSEKL